MHITGASVGGTPPFTQTIEFQFDEQVNLFIGPNGAGKTSLLELLEHESSLIRHAYMFGSDLVEMRLASVSVSEDWDQVIQSQKELPAPNGIFDREYHASLRRIVKAHPPTINIPATLVGHPGPHSNPFRSQTPTDVVGVFGTMLVRGHLDGQDVQFSLDEIRERVEKMAQGEADEGDTITENELAMMKEYNVKTKEAANLMDAIKISHLCAKYICKEVLIGEAPSDYTAFGESSATGLPPGRVDLGVMVQTNDLRTNGERLESIHISSASAGTESTFWWVRLIALVMLMHNEYRFGWEKKSAILFIDEIENHLHPTWQRRVIPALLKHFPGLQIFATTHSPFVAAGLRAGQVHLLNRDANGVITASTNDRDIIGWTADQILRTFMGVDEPTDQLTVDRSNRMRELHGKSSLTADEETELNDLRHSVSADFPQNPIDPQLNAQRKRYADLMQQFLRSRLSDPDPDSESV